MFLGTVSIAFGVACGIWDSLGYLTSPNIEVVMNQATNFDFFFSSHILEVNVLKYFIGGTELGRLTEVICIGICTVVHITVQREIFATFHIF